MNTTDAHYNFIFTVPLPLVVDGGKTMWKLTAATYGKGGGKMEIVAVCIKGSHERIIIADGRENQIIREYRMGMACLSGTLLDQIVRKLVREGRAEILR